MKIKILLIEKKIWCNVFGVLKHHVFRQRFAIYATRTIGPRFIRSLGFLLLSTANISSLVFCFEYFMELGDASSLSSGVIRLTPKSHLDVNTAFSDLVVIVLICPLLRPALRSVSVSRIPALSGRVVGVLTAIILWWLRHKFYCVLLVRCLVISLQLFFLLAFFIYAFGWLMTLPSEPLKERWFLRLLIL